MPRTAKAPESVGELGVSVITRTRRRRGRCRAGSRTPVLRVLVGRAARPAVSAGHPPTFMLDTVSLGRLGRYKRDTGPSGFGMDPCRLARLGGALGSEPRSLDTYFPAGEICHGRRHDGGGR